MREEMLDEVGITVNKNTQFPSRKKARCGRQGGIRLGTPALTTRGMGTKDNGDYR